MNLCATNAAKDGNWVQTWGQSHSALSYFYYPEKKRTFRIVLNTAISGEQVRIRLSNAFGRESVIIDSITVAPCDRHGNIHKSAKIEVCTYNGEQKIILDKGERIVLDPAPLSVTPNTFFCVSAYVTKGDLRSGNLLDNAYLITAPGDFTQEIYCKNKVRPRDSVITIASNLLGFPLHKPIPLFDSIELYNTEGAKSIVVFGDSISQQGYWTTPFEKKIRDAYPGKFSLINKSVMGNRILRDCSPIFIIPGLYGKRATERIKCDVLPYDNISHCILFLGVNDVFEYASINALPHEKPNAKKMCRAIESMTKDMQAKGIKVIMFTIPSFGLAPDATRGKDKLKKRINKWLIENKEIFDGFYDVGAMAADPEDDYYTRKEFIGPDNLHPDAFGGEFFANLVDLDFFK